MNLKFNPSETISPVKHILILPRAELLIAFTGKDVPKKLCENSTRWEKDQIGTKPALNSILPDADKVQYIFCVAQGGPGINELCLLGINQPVWGFTSKGMNYKQRIGGS
jgi:hypothetical protein